MAQVHVSLSERSYDIHIGRGLASRIAEYVTGLKSSGNACSLAVDERVLEAQACFIADAFDDMPRLVLPSGEPTKCFSQLERMCEWLAGQHMARDGVLFTCGGGVTGDLAGFAAASYLRGISFVQIPTTLLSMVDSSVGGKTGINISAGKNLVGAFWQPLAVFADMAVLDTLPPREFSAGMGEVIKYGMLADVELFGQLEALPRLDSRSPELPAIVARCCELKAQVVGADERETAKNDGRALLNLGHTFAHAVENAAGYGTYLHGEAVGLGLFMAARLSQELGLMSAEDVARVRDLAAKYDLPVDLKGDYTKNPLALEALERAAGRDKKVRAGSMRYVVMESLGRARTRDGVDPALVRQLWSEVGAE